MIDWKKEVTVRALNCLEIQFGENFDLNNPKHRLEYTFSPNERIPNWGAKSQKSVDAVIKKYWPDFPTKYNFEEDKVDVTGLREYIKAVRKYHNIMKYYGDFKNNEFAYMLKDYHEFNYLEHYRR